MSTLRTACTCRTFPLAAAAATTRRSRTNPGIHSVPSTAKRAPRTRRDRAPEPAPGDRSMGMRAAGQLETTDTRASTAERISRATSGSLDPVACKSTPPPISAKAAAASAVTATRLVTPSMSSTRGLPASVGSRSMAATSSMSPCSSAARAMLGRPDPGPSPPRGSPSLDDRTMATAGACPSRVIGSQTRLVASATTSSSPSRLPTTPTWCSVAPHCLAVPEPSILSVGGALRGDHERPRSRLPTRTVRYPRGQQKEVARPKDHQVALSFAARSGAAVSPTTWWKISSPGLTWNAVRRLGPGMTNAQKAESSHRNILVAGASPRSSDPLLQVEARQTLGTCRYSRIDTG